MIIFNGQLIAKPFILMLDPAGSAQDTGRLIDDVYERSVTLAYAQTLKQEIEKRSSDMCVVLTRTAGESVEPLQNANFANRLGVDLYIRLHFVQEAGNSVALYHFSWAQNECAIRLPDTSFIPYDKAHLAAMDRTIAWARRFEQSFNARAGGSCKGIFAIPCRPLLGITAPALCIEMGILTKNDWHTYVGSITQAVCS